MTSDHSKLPIPVLILSVFLTLLLFIFLQYMLGDKNRIEITSKPSGASITLDGKVYKTPAIIKLVKGEYELTVHKDGYVPFFKKFQVEKGRDVKMQLVLVNDKVVEPTVFDGNPIINAMPFENDHFSVSWNDDLAHYEVVPKIILNNVDSYFDQISKQWTTYKQYATEGVNWLEQNGANPTKDNVVFWGQEWWPEGQIVSLPN
ncbi:MAG: PEGA domain-containing protein [bacterium]|nr:PEGA domain-containing protein [bacterium]